MTRLDSDPVQPVTSRTLPIYRHVSYASVPGFRTLALFANPVSWTVAVKHLLAHQTHAVLWVGPRVDDLEFRLFHADIKTSPAASVPEF